ncbi:hypothetical protein EHQ12_18260 [Leptospira gomenensis]|uniref:Lipoprotein n=1 Tax=Leptospira gomenensis TaxID=2484974 RepID=A0A5F1Y6Q2_9LEPT|nr:hypothetical protein [Leptospira gomenensis]TGK28992.1 hypothetical protein EHQ17_16685 [Leptospira gomenensis]TGK32815.1 hypothetical protein EHQ12_18260 [Leptospira gomenensis]TGK40751.1 hypothetical protein EHQ07_18030 [Leptospira gomenensis]TGK68405.1 hypothetical protein EHQ13_00025 [Leptospira gomenensis]
MNIKKMALMGLIILAIQCGSKSGDGSKDALTLLALAGQGQSPGISGIYASVIGGGGGGGGGAGALTSSGVSSPFQLLEQTYPCKKGGTFEIKGDVEIVALTTIVYNGVNQIYNSCSRTMPVLGTGTTSSVDMTINGTILMDGESTTTVDPDSTLQNPKFTMNQVARLRSSSYTVNGFTYPTFDLTFTRTNSKVSIENMGDIEKATISVSETVLVVGTIGEEVVNSTFTYSAKYDAF